MSLPKRMENFQKIAILGLGNAGKTSIVKTILYEFRAFTTLLPTTGVDRTDIDFFGHKLVIWDFGGQEQYREIYLTRPIMYFQGIKYLYYVVDAQDPSQLQKSIEYFQKILETAHEFSDSLNVFLFFHKVDPEYKGELDFSYIENTFIDAISENLANYKINPVVFHTSIFNPISVISAFAQPLLGNKTIYDTLCDVVDSFCWERDIPFGFIFVNNFEIGSYYASDSVQSYVQKKISTYLDWLDETDEITKFQLGDYDIYTKPFEIFVGPNEFRFNFTIGVDQLFEVDDVNDIFEEMDDFIQDLEKILPNSEIIRTGELRMEEIFDEDALEELRYNDELLEELSELEDEDREREMQRVRNLSQLDDQYQIMREEDHEFDKSDEDMSEDDNYDDLDEIPEFDSKSSEDEKEEE